MVKLPKIRLRKHREERSFARKWPFALGLGLLLGIAVLVDQGTLTGDTASSACRVEVTAEMLPLRNAPEPTAQGPGDLRRGDIRGATTTVRNGYRQLADRTWALDQYLRPLPPVTQCTPR